MGSLKRCEWIGVWKFGVGGKDREGLKDRLVVELVRVCIGGCVGVGYVCD